MVYDGATRTVILFGGYGDPASSRTVMWAWNGTTWRKLRSGSPVGAGFGWQAAYDPASKQLLIFGAVGVLWPPPSWLWVWTGHSWRKLHTADSPPGRQFGSRRIVVPGGFSPSNVVRLDAVGSSRSPRPPSAIAVDLSRISAGASAALSCAAEVPWR